MPKLIPVLYRIKPEHKKKVKKVATQRSKGGEKVSESAVIRSLISNLYENTN